MKLTVAYWVTPKGEILEPKSYHIGSVIDAPKKFGYTKEKLQKIYDKYDERMSAGLEGRAREEIMTNLLKKGFIRIRRRIRDGYTVQIDRLTPKVEDNLWQWANYELKRAISRYDNVNIYTLKDGKVIKTNLDKIASGSQIKESKSYMNESEISNIRVFTDETIHEMTDYFEYAENLIDEDTDQEVIDEILEYKYSAMMKHLK